MEMNLQFLERRQRLCVVYCGAHVHQAVLEKWCEMRGTADLQKLFCTAWNVGMHIWGRTMPPCDELVSYIDLVRLYVEVDRSIAFSQVELMNAMLNLNVTGKFFSGDVSIQAKKLSGILLTGLSRFRELRVDEKLKRAVKHASTIQKVALTALGQSIVVNYDSVPPVLSSDTQIVPYVAPPSRPVVEQPRELTDMSFNELFEEVEQTGVLEDRSFNELFDELDGIAAVKPTPPTRYGGADVEHK